MGYILKSTFTKYIHPVQCDLPNLVKHLVLFSLQIILFKNVYIFVVVTIFCVLNPSSHTQKNQWLKSGLLKKEHDENSNVNTTAQNNIIYINRKEDSIRVQI